MGLFNFNFGSSKKDKPIRDKIKNRKYFNELLKELSKDKDETERYKQSDAEDGTKRWLAAARYSYIGR